MFMFSRFKTSLSDICRLSLTALVIVSAFSAAAALPPPAAKTNTRASLLAAADVPSPVKLPVPRNAIALPDDWARTDAPVTIHFSKQPSGDLSVRRVSHNDGLLYLGICSAKGRISGDAEVAWNGQPLGKQRVKGSLWLSLKPRIGKIQIQISSPAAKEPVRLTAPTTLVEIRGRSLFLKGEPFLLKGATGRVQDQREADLVHSLGINALRGLESLSGCEQYGFMNISSLNFGNKASTKIIAGPDKEFQDCLVKSLDWLKQNAAAPIASPNTLILQLGNERTGGYDAPGEKPLTDARRHASQLVAAARNLVKPLCPRLPAGYASQDIAFLAPDCLDVY